MQKRQTKAESDSSLLYKKRCLALFKGIDKEAWEVIEAIAKVDLPVFQFREPDGTGGTRALQMDAKTLVLMAAVKDGEQGFFKTLKTMRKHGESVYGE